MRQRKFLTPWRRTRIARILRRFWFPVERAGNPSYRGYR